MSEKNQGAAEALTSSKSTLERTYRTSAEELWKMWTTKDGFESWWAPEGFRTEVHVIEARPNGKLHFDMIAYTLEVIDFLTERGLPTANLQHCRFSIFRPLEQLELKMLMDFVPGVETYENTILVDILPAGDSVHMVATLGPVHDEEFLEICTETLGRQLTNLGKQLNGTAE